MARALLAAALLALALAPTAVAKAGPTTMEVCGASECATVVWDGSGSNPFVFELVMPEYETVAGSLRFAPAPPPGPFYELRFEPDWTGQGSRYITADAGLLLAGSNWLELEARLSADVRSAIAGIEPFPTPAMTGATVDGKAASPAEYVGLLGRLDPAGVPTSLGDSVAVALQAERTTPWTLADVGIVIYPEAGVVRRSDGWFRLPDGFAQGQPTGGDLPPVWGWALGGAAIVAVAVFLLALRRTRSAAPRTSQLRL